ncbi:hypothetical protein CTI12_AA439880 [Artemisia annua]|uniref:KIB1-4 beta-propeller domain-containing protein n=1 Tax=Artemisia annua TaxID=35608 RepID=A0A2U1LYB3_ARTAN|nr:hypothetical protein CTI12_AA439880 [Artemisia annua]
MEQRRISSGSVLDKLPPLSTKYPWFIAQNLKGKQVDDYIDHQIFYTIHSPQFHYRCQIPELLGRQIRACFHGWMILSNHPMWFLWNPLTSKLIHLPPLRNTPEDIYECCLSSPPDDPSSMFLLTTENRPTITFCRLDRKRNKLRWTEMSYAKQLRSITNEDEDGFLGNMTCCDGKVYALPSGLDTVIEVEIVVKEKEVVIRLRPFLELPCFSVTKFSFTKGSFDMIDFLKGSCRDLFFVSVVLEVDTCKILDVYLFKLDMTRKIWEEMEDLKEAVFFLHLAGDQPIYYSPEIATELGGYVHILDEMGKILYSYDVKNRTLSLSSTSSLLHSNDVSSWALLECRLKDDQADFKQEKKDKEEEMVVKVVAEDDDKLNSTLVKSHLFNIPFHMLGKIMEHSVSVEYMKFRATCKSCHLAAPPIQWSNKALLTRLKTYSLLSPWLMVLNIQRGTITFTDPMFGDKYYMRIPKELIGYSQIYCSKYGWLLMHKESVHMVFFNPFTSDIKELPRAQVLQSCCFSAPPTSPGCMVLGFTSRGQCHIHFVGQEAIWRSLGITIDIDQYSFPFPTLHGQDLYALCNEGGLDVFRRHGEVNYSWEHGIAKPPTSSCGSSTQYILAKCDKHLLLVIMGKFGESVEVFKFNDFGREWEKIDCLGKHTIYICDAACVCVESKTPQMENNVYFPRLHPDNGKIVFYSLETCRYHTSNDQNVEESLGDLFRTTQHWDPHSWIEPSWS